MSIAFFSKMLWFAPQTSGRTFCRSPWFCSAPYIHRSFFSTVFLHGTLHFVANQVAQTVLYYKLYCPTSPVKLPNCKEDPLVPFQGLNRIIYNAAIGASEKGLIPASFEGPGLGFCSPSRTMVRLRDVASRFQGFHRCRESSDLIQ